MGEWKKVKLSDCIKEVVERTTENNQYQVLSVTKDGIFSQEDFFKKQIASDNNIGYKIIRRNNLVFSTMNLWMGSLDVLTNFDIGIVSPAYKIFKFNETLMIPSYGNYFLKSYYMLEQYKKCSEQGASVVRRNLDLKALLNTRINIPTIAEQKKIVKTLENIDIIIEHTKRDINIHEDFKKSIFKKYYEKLNSSNSYTSKLEDICAFLKGNGLSKMDLSVNGNECILYGELYTKYKEIAETIYSKTEVNIKNPLLSIKEDVLIPSSGETAIDISTATCVMVDNVIIGGDLNLIRKKRNNIDGRYISYVINYIKKYEIAKLAQGFSVVHLYSNHIKNLKVKYPDLLEQKKLIDLLEVINKKNNVLKIKAERLVNLKKGLMQQLLTGKIKVKI